jgi:CBS domain-containing protein
VGVKVATILSRKGSGVVSIAPERTLGDAAVLMARRGIGALIVSADGRAVDGILSERDLVGHLATAGAQTPTVSVRDAMTTEVATCTAETTTDELSALMTERRFRHVPVLENGVLIGIISIGDVVKSRMDELASETEQLQAYVAGSY